MRARTQADGQRTLTNAHRLITGERWLKAGFRTSIVQHYTGLTRGEIAQIHWAIHNRAASSGPSPQITTFFNSKVKRAETSLFALLLIRRLNTLLEDAKRKAKETGQPLIRIEPTPDDVHAAHLDYCEHRIRAELHRGQRGDGNKMSVSEGFRILQAIRDYEIDQQQCTECGLIYWIYCGPLPLSSKTDPTGCCWCDQPNPEATTAGSQASR